MPRVLIAYLAVALLSSCFALIPQPAVAQLATNRSPLGLNLSSAVAWETDWFFVNIAHHSLGWFPPGQEPTWGAWLQDSELNSQGYLQPGFDGILCIIWDAPEPINQEFVISWEGSAAVRPLAHWSNPEVVSQSPNQLNLRLNGDTFLFVEIVNNSEATPISNIQCKRIEHADLEQTFTPAFLDFVAEFGAVRFMDWMDTNNSDVAAMDDYTQNGALIQRPVAFEYMIELANTLGIDPWFCVPLQANDDFVLDMSEQIRNNLNPDLTVRVELSNEVWNGIFDQHQKAAQQARALELTSSENDWEAAPIYYGYRSAQIHNIIEADLQANQPERTFCPLIAWQSVNSWFVNRDVVPQYRAERAGGAAPQAMALAPYFGGSLGSPNRQAEVSGWSLDQVFDQLLNGSVYPDDGNVNATMQHVIEYRDQLEDWGITDLICYEAGQHLVGHGGAENNQELTDLFIAANRDARMQTVYAAYLQAWRELGGGLMAMFASHGRPSKWGSWGMRETLSQSVDLSPKYRACSAFIDANPVNWTGCSFEWLGTNTSVAAAEAVNRLILRLTQSGSEFSLNVAAPAQLTILNLLGRKVYSTKIGTAPLQFSTADWPAGIYLLHVQTHDNSELRQIALTR